jgi:hypothetical protein
LPVFISEREDAVAMSYRLEAAVVWEMRRFFAEVEWLSLLLDKCAG